MDPSDLLCSPVRFAASHLWFTLRKSLYPLRFRESHPYLRLDFFSSFFSSISGSFIYLDSIYLAPPDLLSLVLGLSILRLGAFHHSLWGISFSNFGFSNPYLGCIHIPIRIHSSFGLYVSFVSHFPPYYRTLMPLSPSQSSSSSSSSPAFLHHLLLLLMSNSRFVSFLSTSFGDIPALSWVYFSFLPRIPLCPPCDLG